MKHRALLILLLLFTTVRAQEKPATPAENQTSTPPPTSTAAPTANDEEGAPTAGQGWPPVLIRASQTSANVKLLVTLDQTGEPEPADFELGALSNAQNPNQQADPTIDSGKIRRLDAQARVYALDLDVSGLGSFGESSVPLLFKGRPVEVLRFTKVGLTVQLPERSLVARERDEVLLLVLHNPSPFPYKGVLARVRFNDRDVCAPPSGAADCTDSGAWTAAFTASPFSDSSVRLATRPEWFRDPDSNFARSAVRTGVLTLRFPAESGGSESQQNIPIEVRFEPRSRSIIQSMAFVGVMLLAGAILSLLLRVSVPNFRRKKLLKDQLNDARRAIADLSASLDPQLRVLLRVERLALDQRRKEGWVLLPEFADIAARVETGLATLTRKIGFAQRLDAASCRREALLAGPVAPTRIDAITRELETASGALKNDQISEADWTVIQQRLELADKLLDQPSEEEKQAFEATLSRRWKSVSQHFGLTPDPADPKKQTLNTSAPLGSMNGCFPDSSLLPRVADVDGTEWISSIGPIRADLQLTALEMVREVQFLAPATNHNQKWTVAMGRLAQWLATPAIMNLQIAREQLLQLAEGVSDDDIAKALGDGQAYIDLDPSVVSANQTVRLAVRFRDPQLNTATARMAITCEWRFPEPARKARWSPTSAKKGAAAPPPPEQTEHGWSVNRYFEPDVVEQAVEARFFWKGNAILAAQAGPPVTVTRMVVAEDPNRKADHVLARYAPATIRFLATLLVPLAALITTTAGEPSTGRVWELIGLGFGSETIRGILTGPTPGDPR